MSKGESSVSKGFGVTCGILLALFIVVGGLATVAVIGCVGAVGVGTGAVKQAQDAAERVRVRQEQEAEAAAKEKSAAEAAPAAEPVPAEPTTLDTPSEATPEAGSTTTP